MTSSFGWNNDLQLFLNVINGCIILHCEDTALLRFCLASLINTSRHFKHIFSMNGSVSTISYSSGHFPSFNFLRNRNCTSRKKTVFSSILDFKLYICIVYTMFSFFHDVFCIMIQLSVDIVTLLNVLNMNEILMLM